MTVQQQLVDVLHLLGEDLVVGKSVAELAARLEVPVRRLQESCALLKSFVLEVASVALPWHESRGNAVVPGGGVASLERGAYKDGDVEAERRHLADLLQLLQEALTHNGERSPGRSQRDGFILSTRSTLVAELMALQDVLGLGEPLAWLTTSEGLEDLQLIVREACSGLQQLLLTLVLPEERDAHFSALDTPRTPLPPPEMRPAGRRF